jgi:membrane protease YdiL (CAAX protease family)
MGRFPWWLPFLVYGPLGVLGAGLSWWQRGQVLTAPHLPLFAERRGLAQLLGLTLALVVTVVTVASTRWLVARAGWARDLHGTLRGALLGLSSPRLLVLALLSSLAEELLFRAALLPIIGVFASSLLFGALHISSRASYLPWMLWATLMGFVFALLFVGSGALWAPLLAHAAINYENMLYLCSHDPALTSVEPAGSHREPWRRL